MKSPLSYQTTEYDCGPTTLTNAISFLFRREEIPPDIIKHIVLYSLDAYNDKGEFGKRGTSQMAMVFLSSWLNQFGKVKDFPIHCEPLAGDEVRLRQNSKIMVALQQGGAVVARVHYGCWHYVLLTSVDAEYVYLFDPYYRKRPFQIEGVELIRDEPEKYNRKIRHAVLSSHARAPYALGPPETREAVILFNLRTQKTPARTIEYFI